jgi:hypothetical protein
MPAIRWKNWWRAGGKRLFHVKICSNHKKREDQRLYYAILIGGDEGTRTTGLLTDSKASENLCGIMELMEKIKPT